MKDTRSDDELNRIIAEWCGWVPSAGDLDCKKIWHEISGAEWVVRPPNYCRDLNAVHEAEKKLTDYQYDLYYGPFLGAVTKAKSRRDISSAGARHRAEALVRVIEEVKPCEGLQAGGLCDEIGLVPDWSEE